MSVYSFFKVLILLLGAISVHGKPLEDEAVCKTDSLCPAYDPDVLNVHIIPHSHDDVGWVLTVQEYYDMAVDDIISTVIDSLLEKPERRFIQVETAFFKMWWEQQDDARRNDVIELTNSGRLEFVSGGWAMNDEAATHYQSTIDQFTLGFRYLADTVGECARPRTGWQIDPFGHSREQASISAQLGFDSVSFWRIDYRDKEERLVEKRADLLWRGSASLGNSSDIFTSAFLGSYYDPSNDFCWDIDCHTEEITDENQELVVKNFALYSQNHADQFLTNNIMVPFGGDFRYQNATKNFRNLDRLVEGFELYPQTYNGKPIRVIYSTPTCYTKFVHEYVTANDYEFEIKTDDFFPYADRTLDYWTGYFTSRPASKRFERSGNHLLQVTKQLSALNGGAYENGDVSTLKEAVAMMQHHDAITGTEKQYVAKNYHLILKAAMDRASSASNQFLSAWIGGEGTDLKLESCLLANVSSCSPAQGDKFTVVLYNPLSRAVDSPVQIPVNSESWTIMDSDDKEVPYQTSEPIQDFGYITEGPVSKYNLDFIAQQVPALGFKVYKFEVSSKVKKPASDSIKKAPETFIGYDDINFGIDEDTGLLFQVTMQGISLDISQEFLFYSSLSNSGAYLFSPDGTTGAQKIAAGAVKTTPISGDVYEGVVQEFSDWAKQVIKVYKGENSYIEFDWIVGPLEQHHSQGTEVISRYSTYLKSNKEFYTDANGREVLKRTRNFRADYNYTNDQPVAGNYYPVNSKIAIEDETNGIRLAVLTDRSAGGSSLADGELEIMVHRRCHNDDGRGVGEVLNEQEYDKGIIVRGKHYLVIANIAGDNGASAAAIERDIAQRVLLPPWSFITAETDGNWNTLQDSALTSDLPSNVHILSLESWQEDTLLLRLEHTVAVDEDATLSQDVQVDLTDLFSKFTISELQETALGGNILLGDVSRLQWPGSVQPETASKVLDVAFRTQRAVDDLKIDLAPMQIRTFWAKIVPK